MDNNLILQTQDENNQLLKPRNIDGHVNYDEIPENNNLNSQSEKIRNNAQISKFEIDLYELNNTLFNQNLKNVSESNDVQSIPNQIDLIEQKKCKLSSGESNVFIKISELRKEENSLRCLLNIVNNFIQILEKRFKDVTDGLARTTKEGRQCRSKSLAPFSGPKNFPLVSKDTLQTPHLCHISSIQFHEAQLYGRFKHFPNFPQHVQSYSCGLRMFAHANAAVKRINATIDQRKSLSKGISDLKVLAQTIEFELKQSTIKVEAVKKVIDKSRSGKEKYIGIKNRYFASLRLMNPTLEISNTSRLSDQKDMNFHASLLDISCKELESLSPDDLYTFLNSKYQSIISAGNIVSI
jgi:hypothetical protein